MNLQDAIRTRIQELMNAQQLTVSELSRRAGLRQSTVNSIIKGDVKTPTVHSTHLIAKAMGISLHQFFLSPHFEHLENE